MAIHPGPQVALFAPDQASLRDLGPVPDDLQVRIATDWESFERHASNAHIMAVVLPELVGPDFDALVGARLRFWNIPLVLLTSGEPRNLLQLRHAIIEEVVTWADRGAAFWETMERFTTVHLRQRLVTHIRRSFPDHRRIIEILESVLLNDPPPKTVIALAHHLYVVDGTVRYRWRTYIRDVGLKELLCWGILLRAMELWPLLGSWEEVAGALGVDLRTLGSYARRLTGASLEKLERKPSSFVPNTFHEKVLAKLARELRAGCLTTDPASRA